MEPLGLLDPVEPLDDLLCAHVVNVLEEVGEGFFLQLQLFNHGYAEPHIVVRVVAVLDSLVHSLHELVPVSDVPEVGKRSVNSEGIANA